MAPIEELHLDAITGGMQTRACIDSNTVTDYAEALKAAEGKAGWPPIVVFRDAVARNWLADGFHRVAAGKKAGLEALPAEIRDGTQWDALRYALSANATHGLRRCHKDIARAIRMAYENRLDLGLPDVPSAKLIGDLVGVSHHTADRELGKLPGWRDATARTGADGKTRAVPPRPPSPPPVAPAAPAAAQEPAGGPPVAPGKRSFGPPPTPPPKAVVRDEVGQAVPPELHALWARRQEAQDLLTALSRIRGAVRRYEEAKDPLGCQASYNTLHASLNQAYASLEVFKPYAVCPMCQGLLGCRLCGGSGLLSKFHWEHCVSEQIKERVCETVSRQER